MSTRAAAQSISNKRSISRHHDEAESTALSFSPFPHPCSMIPTCGRAHTHTHTHIHPLKPSHKQPETSSCWGWGSVLLITEGDNVWLSKHLCLLPTPFRPPHHLTAAAEASGAPSLRVRVQAEVPELVTQGLGLSWEERIERCRKPGPQYQTQAAPAGTRIPWELQ